MYKNPGSKLKDVISTIVFLEILLCIITGIVVLIVMASNDEFWWGLLAGGLIVAVGWFAAWLGGLLIETFGDMADSLYEIRQILFDETAKARGALHRMADAEEAKHFTSKPSGEIPAEKIPAWKRIQMEEEAKKKAEEQ